MEGQLFQFLCYTEPWRFQKPEHKLLPSPNSISLKLIQAFSKHFPSISLSSKLSPKAPPKDPPEQRHQAGFLAVKRPLITERLHSHSPHSLLSPLGLSRYPRLWKDSGHIFLSIIGCLFGAIAVLLYLFLYPSKAVTYQERSVPSLIGSMRLPISLFWFDTPWIIPMTTVYNYIIRLGEYLRLH